MQHEYLLRLISLAGLAVFIGIAWLISENRKQIDWRLVGWGLILQFFFGLLILDSRPGHAFFAAVKSGFDIITSASTEGARFLFGNLTQPFVLGQSAVVGAKSDFAINALVAFQALPVIIFVSALAGILFHLRVIQTVVGLLAGLMRRTLRTSGAETFATALLVFLGIESMTAIRAYIKNMTRSELLTIMTAFMATIAASVMVAYASFGAQPGHLLAASLMSAPAAILIAKIIIPETQTPETTGRLKAQVPVESQNLIDAAARGASEGLTMALNVGAMLIAFIGLVYLLDKTCMAITAHSFTQLMGWVFQPFAFIMGVTPKDTATVGQLLGTKTVLNEFIAYANLKLLIESAAISPRSITIVTYALCGFANPGSLAILIGGLAGIVPERRGEIAALGVKSFIAGTLACFMTACVAGVMTHA